MTGALPAAVPEYQRDLDEAHRALGQAHLYIAQLHRALAERAVEANDIHDRLVAAEAALAGLRATTDPNGS